MKILAIQFRYLGDAALLTPALRSLKELEPGCELHLLVAREVVPLFQHLPWLTRVWAFPRQRGSAGIGQAWPVLRALRQERFDRSVDFAGNDRGALVSLLCGAKQRVAPFRPGGFLGRRFCYHRLVRFSEAEFQAQHQALRNFRTLSAWGILPPACPELEIHTDPALARLAEQLWPRPGLLCHVATSQPKKEWPLAHWAELYRLASAAGHEVLFSSGPARREQELLDGLRRLVPGLPTLPTLPELATFLAVLGRAQVYVSGDTGPLHLAAGLGVPTIGLFGPSSSRIWAPLGKRHQVIQAAACSCSPHDAICSSPTPCMASIAPADVMALLARAKPL
jgi:heptosyltransferase III